MKITILGSGTSTGVPQVGCTCEVCRSTDARDNRLRCSGLVEADGVRILIDCGPDFRQQMLRLDDYRPIDGVLITHEHYDHVGGLDDLRPFCHFRDIPVYAESDTAERLKRRIPYCFTEHLYPGVPHIPLEKIAEGVPFTVSNMQGNSVEVRRSVEQLAPRERQIMELRFGLVDGVEHTQKEAADALGISQSYISRLEKRIIRQLKEVLERE